MKTVGHTCPKETSVLDFLGNESIDNIVESVDELRENLANMKRLIEEKKGSNLGEFSARKRKENSDIINGNFLAWVFLLAVIVITTVSIYTLYNFGAAFYRKVYAHHADL